MNFVMKARDGYYEFGTTTLPIEYALTRLTLHRRAMEPEDANRLLEFIQTTFVGKRIEDYCYALSSDDLRQIRAYAAGLSGFTGANPDA